MDERRLRLAVSGESGNPRRARALAALQVAVAIVLLGLVARWLPWRDQLEWKPREGAALTLAGRIQGDWQADAIRFELAEGEEPDAAWPADLAASLRAGAPLERRAPGSDDGELAWKPGIVRVVGEVELRGLALGVALFSCALLCGITRWWRLLALAGCPTSWWQSLRLTFIGLFFNLLIPGLTGGDLIKAVAIARAHPGRRLEALFSIGIDRVVGLAVLLVLAAAVLLAFAGPELAVLRLPVALAATAAVVGGLALVHSGLRRWLRLDALLARLPLGAKLALFDQALLAFGRRPFEIVPAALLSLGNHCLVIVGVWSLGRAYGESALGLTDYFAIVPVANAISAVPIAPAGWGVGELAYQTLFELAGAGAVIGVAVSATFRICQMALGLAGGVFLLVPGERARVRAYRSAEAGVDQSAGPVAP